MKTHPPFNQPSRYKTAICWFLLIIIPGSFLLAGEQEKYYFVFLNTKPDRLEISEAAQQELQKGHFANMERLYKARKMIAAGPLVGGGGIFILVANSLTEARDSLQTDPAIQANRFNLEVFPFSLDNGRLCWLESGNDDYQMVNYQMVRFSPANREDSETAMQKNSGAHQAFIDVLPDSAVIAGGLFSKGRDGGLLLLNVDSAEAAEKMVDAHPHLAEKKWALNVRTLWVAKETFCN